jgi:hypothetical protein
LLVFAALALLGGAAFAASRFDALPWFNQSDRSTATFVIDSSRKYEGPTAQTLTCPDAGRGTFLCKLAPLYAPGGQGFAHTRRTYMMAEQVEARPHFSRQSYLDAIAADERKGQISHADADKVRQDIAGSGDDFFSALALVSGIETIGGGGQVPGRPGYELVPPPGVPMWTACEIAYVSTFRCHALASSRNIAVGTPIYILEQSRDWVAVPSKSKRPPNVAAFLHAVMHRDLRPAEAALMIDLITFGRSSASSGDVQPAPPPGTTTRRGG